MSEDKKHRNDIYGEIGSDSGSPAIPAATVVLVRETAGSEPGIEVLMLQKNTNISFGGMWVFPADGLTLRTRNPRRMIWKRRSEPRFEKPGKKPVSSSRNKISSGLLTGPRHPAHLNDMPLGFLSPG